MRFLPRCWGLGGASRDEEADDADWGVVAAGVVDTVSKAVQHHVGGAGCTIGVDKVEGLWRTRRTHDVITLTLTLTLNTRVVPQIRSAGFGDRRIVTPVWNTTCALGGGDA